MTAGVPDCDVVIIGGGPGGLSTALGLTRAVKDIRVKVLERAKQYRPMGAGIGIDVNGMKAIEAIDPSLRKWFNAEGHSLSSSIINDHKGNFIREDKNDTEKAKRKYGISPTLMGWYEIQQAFFRLLPADTVTFDSRFQTYEESDEGVEVSYTEAGEPKQLRCKLLVGADGYFSAVRQQCLQDGPPDFAGTVFWRARLKVDKVHEKPQWFFGDEKLGLILPISKDHMVWTCAAPAKLLEAAGVKFDPSNGGAFRASTQAVSDSPENALDRCMVLFKDHPEVLVSLMRQTDPSTVAEHGIFTRAPESYPEQRWGRGRVTLIGDAAHPVRPTGQGLNMTMEDAAELAWHVQQYGLTADALERFEAKRIPRVTKILDHAKRQGEAAYNKEGKDATANNRALALADEWQEFKDGIVFQALRPEEERDYASVEKADISSAGLATQDSSSLGGLNVKRATLLCGALAATALSALAMHTRRT